MPHKKRMQRSLQLPPWRPGGDH